MSTSARTAAEAEALIPHFIFERLLNQGTTAQHLMNHSNQL